MHGVDRVIKDRGKGSEGRKTNLKHLEELRLNLIPSMPCIDPFTFLMVFNVRRTGELRPSFSLPLSLNLDDLCWGYEPSHDHIPAFMLIAV